MKDHLNTNEVYRSRLTTLAAGSVHGSVTTPSGSTVTVVDTESNVTVATVPSVMEVLLNYPGMVEIEIDDVIVEYPKVELVEKLEGWPEPEPEIEDELI